MNDAAAPATPISSLVLDAAFHFVWTTLTRPPFKAIPQASRLAQEFPEVPRPALVEAERRARHLLDAAITLCETADAGSAKPTAEGLRAALVEKCPGFSPASYAQALASARDLGA